MGVERLLFAIIANNLKTEQNGDEEREVLCLPFDLAPYKVAVAPLTNKLDIEANVIYNELLKQDIGPIKFAKGGSIGKRYRKEDNIGTPFVITVDFDTAQDKKVTIRNRDTMEQDRISIPEIKKYITDNAK
jgi:glycyl-tRNA synthetase